MMKYICKKIESLFLFLTAVITCYPIVFLFTGALMGNWEIQEALGPILGSKSGYGAVPLLPLYPTLKSYVEILLDTPEFFVMFWNSVKITGFVLAGQLVISVPAAWGFARFRFPLKKFLFTLYIILMMMPFQVTMLSNYLVLDQMKLLDTSLSIILPGIFSTFPVFLMYRFFAAIPNEILESARIDGASEWQIFIQFGIPLGSSGIIAAMVLQFLEYWNLIEQPLTFIKKKALWPLSLYLPDISLENAGKALASSVLTLFPALLVFLAGQDYLERGIAASALKE